MKPQHARTSVNTGLLVALAVLGLMGSVANAQAAVRKCAAFISSDIVRSDISERDAKTKALAQWQSKAREIGQGYRSWRLAAQKALRCFKEQGQFACVAIGNPCIIVQNPKRLQKSNEMDERSL